MSVLLYGSSLSIFISVTSEMIWRPVFILYCISWSSDIYILYMYMCNALELEG